MRVAFESSERNIFPSAHKLLGCSQLLHRPIDGHALDSIVFSFIRLEADFISQHSLISFNRLSVFHSLLAFNFFFVNPNWFSAN